MTSITHLALTITLIFSAAFVCSAQTPTVNVTTDRYQAQFAAQGEAHEMRVEVFSPSGEMVFDSGTTTGEIVQWKMRDEKGERVADGVYLATISIKEASGKIRKRIEQITVYHQQQSAPRRSPDAVEAAITGSGTSNTIAKFTGAATIGNSPITVNAGKVGINTNPTSVLQINETQPAASTSDGTAATTLLQTSGGKGGNTTAAGKTGGAGASISVVAGNGGNAVAGATNGRGGSITLQPGSPGTGGAPPDPGGGAGNVLLAPTVGNVGIGTNSPSAKLAVNGELEVQNGSSTGVSSFSDGGTAVFAFDASSGIGVRGSSSGNGLEGFSDSGKGVRGSSTTGYAGYFDGKAKVTKDLAIDGDESFGANTRQMINLYNSIYGIGVQSKTFYFRSNSGYAWYKGGSHSDSQNDAGGGTVLMKLSGAGNLTVTGTVTATNISPTSDRNMKANFFSVNPRSVLTKLAAIPIQTWNYKSESTDVRHLGPTAQDFRTAFNLGADDKHISTVDADGVTMAAIQGLYQQNQELIRTVQQQTAKSQGYRRG